MASANPAMSSTNGSGQSPTRQIAELCLAYQYDSLPDDVITIARLAIADNIGCAIRGAREPLVQILGDELLERQIVATDFVPGADMGTDMGAKQTEHALLHATSAHAIDFDDTLIPARSPHTGSVVVGAMLAIGQGKGLSGKAMIEAVVAGYEVAARIGGLLHPDHYLGGFHSTGTVGVFAATAVACRLMGLNVEQTCRAFGMAATQASGIKCSFGTMAKPFNAGKAAASGVLAARLVARGFSAPADALEADTGYLNLFKGVPVEERRIAPGTVFVIRENLFKYHAACHATHLTIEGLKRLREEHEFTAEDVERVDIEVSELALKTASIVHPTSGLECKFSFNQMAACALADVDTAADATYSDDILSDARLNALREKVHVRINDDLPIDIQSFSIATKSGANISKTQEAIDLMSELTSQEDDIRRKFLANTSTIGTARAERLLATILDLGNSN